MKRSLRVFLAFFVAVFLLAPVSAAALSPAPVGNFERATAVTGGIEVKGWAIDPDTSDPIYVWVTLDGAGRHLYANTHRPDVGAAYPAYGPDHGFQGTLTATPGTHTVCVTASNVGPGAHRNLGCRSVLSPALMAVWPSAEVVFDTPEAAAEDFVTQALGVPASLGEFQAEDARSGWMDVFFAGGGVPALRSSLVVSELGPNDGWFVRFAISENESITAPEHGDEVPAGPLTVEGAGRGFEGLVVVEAFLAGDTDLLDQQTVLGGSAGTPEPFSTTIDLSGTSPGDVVTILVRGGVGNEDDPGDFTATAVVIGG
jgi:hypothetical protein